MWWPLSAREAFTPGEVGRDKDAAWHKRRARSDAADHYRHSNFTRTILVFVAFAATGIVDPSRLENLAFADNVGFKMYRNLRIAAVGLSALSLFGCISSNPSSEVMVDTNAKTRQAMPGQPQNVVPASKLGDPTLSGE